MTGPYDRPEAANDIRVTCLPLVRRRSSTFTSVGSRTRFLVAAASRMRDAHRQLQCCGVSADAVVTAKQQQHQHQQRIMGSRGRPLLRSAAVARAPCHRWHVL